MSSNDEMSTPPPLGSAVHLESPLVVGLAIQLCWLACLAAPPLFLAAYAPPLREASPLLAGCFLVAFSAGCFAIGALRGKLTYYLRKKSTHFLVGVIGSACLLGAIASAGLPASLGPIPTCAAVAGSALCCAVATLIWGEAARRRSPAVLATTTLLSFLAASLLALGLSRLILSEPLGFATLMSLCPLTSVIFMYKAQHDNESYLKPQEFVASDEGVSLAKEGRSWVETTHELRISKRGFALRLGRSALPFGLAFGVLALQLLATPATQPDDLARILGAASLPAAGVCAFTLLAFVVSRPDDHAPTVRATLPFLVAFLLIVAGSGDGANPGGLAGVLLLALVLFWMYPAEITKQYRITPMLTFGFFAGFFALGALASLPIAQLLAAVGIGKPWAEALCACVYLVGCAALITDEQMRAITIIETPPASPDKNEGDVRAATKERMPFHERCQLTADLFLLSHRELEILYLLAKGRNAAFIQRELVISEGTVRTHMRNIYHKMGVHSQQELMDLVESIVPPADRD